MASVSASLDWKEAAATWKLRYPTSALQADYILLKFPDIPRDAVFALLTQFQTFDGSKQGELEEDESLRLLEARGETKTFVELRKAVADIDLDKNRKLCFLELCCSVFKKSWQLLHTPSADPSTLAQVEELRKKMEQWKLDALNNADVLTRKAAEKFAALQEVETERLMLARANAEKDEELQRNRREEEEKKAREEAHRNQALGQAGVKGKAAMFHYAGTDTTDSTASNAEKIKREAAERREKLRLEAEHKKKEEEVKQVREDAERTVEEQKRMSQQATEAAQREAEVEAERQRVAKAKADMEAYEAAKAKSEEDERQKKEEEEKKKADSKARLAAKAALFTGKP